MAQIAFPGLAAGWVAGLAMLTVAMIHASIAQLGPLWPLERVAAGVLGEGRLEGLAAVLVGLAIHLVVAGVWGVLYATVVPRGAPNWVAAASGLAMGFVVFLVMTWLVLPRVDEALFYSVRNGVLLLYHLLYGALLPLAIPFRRQVTGPLALKVRR